MKGAATKRHVRIFRAVAGAIKNTRDAHPELKISRLMAASIAKRAAGTLASMADVGAQASDRANGTPIVRWPPPLRPTTSEAKIGGRRVRRRSPLAVLHKDVGLLASEARRNGDHVRHQAFVEVLRLIGAMSC